MLGATAGRNVRGKGDERVARAPAPGALFLVRAGFGESWPALPEVWLRAHSVLSLLVRAFWFTRNAGEVCHTVTAKLPRDERKNGASERPHWRRRANPSRRGPHH